MTLRPDITPINDGKMIRYVSHLSQSWNNFVWVFFKTVIKLCIVLARFRLSKPRQVLIFKFAWKGFDDLVIIPTSIMFLKAYCSLQRCFYHQETTGFSAPVWELMLTKVKTFAKKLKVTHLRVTFIFCLSSSWDSKRLKLWVMARFVFFHAPFPSFAYARRK